MHNGKDNVGVNIAFFLAERIISVFAKNDSVTVVCEGSVESSVFGQVSANKIVGGRNLILALKIKSKFAKIDLPSGLTKGGVVLEVLAVNISIVGHKTTVAYFRKDHQSLA